MKKKYDAILLLGVELGERDEPTDELRARVHAAAQAYDAGRAARIVACGGQLPGHERAEADVMARLLEEAGVPAQAILRERESQDTMENMRFAARLLGGAKGKRVLVVTSDYHLRRACMTARRIGFRADGEAAVLAHDAAWKALKCKEWAYTLDLVMGWQDEGKSRPAWTYRLFDAVFARRGDKTA